MDSLTGQQIQTLFIRINYPQNGEVLNIYLKKLDGSPSIDARVFVNADYFHFKDGQAIAIKANKKIEMFERSASQVSVSKYGEEVELKPILKEKLKTLAESEFIVIQAKGTGSDVTGKFSKEDMDLLRAFLK